VGSHLTKRFFVGNIRDRKPRPLGTERPRRLLPARRPHPQLLAEQGHEDLRLLRAEPRQRGDPLEQLGSRPGGLPQARGVAVILLHEQPRQVLHAGRHRLGVTVQGGPFGEDERQRVRVEFGEFGGGRLVPEPPDQVQRRAEGALERYLLVEQHGDQQGERAAGQQFVGLRRHGHPDRHGAPPRVSRSRVMITYARSVPRGPDRPRPESIDAPQRYKLRGNWAGLGVPGPERRELEFA